MKRPASVPFWFSDEEELEENKRQRASNVASASAARPVHAGHNIVSGGDTIASVHDDDVDGSVLFVPRRGVARHRGATLRREGPAKEAAAQSGFRLLGTSEQAAHANPPSFIDHPLRQDQCQSLNFMVEQERRVIKFKAPEKQPLQKILNASIADPVSTVTFEVRGGILGDRMGYGKTAITIALMSLDSRGRLPANPKPDDLFSSRATLIIVPSHLLQQWEDEIHKFLGDRAMRFKIIQINSIHALKKLTVQELAEADVVLATSTCSASGSPVYKKRLFDFSGLSYRTNFCRAKPSFQASPQGPAWQREPIDLSTRSKIRHAQSNAVAKRLSLQDKFPVLEIFYWRRLILDEFHESELWGQGQRETIEHMAAHSRWGLSGTPPIGDALSVSNMAALLGIKVHYAHPTYLQRFLDSFVRQNSLEMQIPVEERIVKVTLTSAEQLFYRQQCRDADILNPDNEEAVASISAEARDRLLQRCADFSFESTDGTARGACERISDEKAKTVKDLEAQLIMDCARYGVLLAKANDKNVQEAREILLEACPTTQRPEGLEHILDVAAGAAQRACLTDACIVPVACPLGGWYTQQPIPSNKYIQNDKEKRALVEALVALHETRSLPAAGWRKAARVQSLALSTLVRHLSDALRSLMFFKAQLATLQGSGVERSCSVCMEEDIPLNELAITSCAHTFHLACLREWLKQQRRCPTCRYAPLTLRHVSGLASELAAPQKQQTDSVESFKDELRQKFGSKIRAMVRTFREIRRSDLSAKVLIFSQWDEMLDRIGVALAAYDIRHLRIESQKEKRHKSTSATVLRKFQEEQGPSATPVLLLSLESSASGSNLTAANHVFLVSPMSAENPESAVAYERQAVARVRRPGQERDRVYIWRFVSQGTIEESITKSHQQELING